MWHRWKMAAFQRTFYMANWQQGKDQQDVPTMLQGRMQVRPPGTWHKHRLLGSFCHRQRCLETHSKSGVITIWRNTASKSGGEKVSQKDCILASRPTTAFTCSKCDRDCHSRIGLHSHNRRCTMGANLWSLEIDRCQWWLLLSLLILRLPLELCLYPQYY